MVNTLDTSTNPQNPVEMREIEELAIGISAANLNPTMLREDVLKFSGIIPNDWTLAKQPVMNPNFAQVTFQNGISVVAQPRVVTFLEAIGSKEMSEMQMPMVARKYVEKLPNAQYQGLSISPKIVVPFPGAQDSARQYITQTLLSAGAWQDFGKAPIQAGINILYELDECQLNLSINEAKLQMPDQSTVAGILFSGSFNYNIASDSEEERLAKLQQNIDKWQSDLAIFREIINERFLGQLGQQQSLFPASL
jgi:hypothetical protein